MNLEPITIVEGDGQHRFGMVIYTIIITCTPMLTPPIMETMIHHHQTRPLTSHQTLHELETPFPPNTENDPPNSPQHTITQTENLHEILNSAIHSLTLGTNVTSLTPFNSPTSSADHQVQSFDGLNQTGHHLSPTQHIHNTSITNEETNSPFSMRPSWHPPVSSDLRWTWVGSDGPFITNGELRETNLDSSETESESVTERLFNLDTLNEDIPEVLVGAALRRGQIPESPLEIWWKLLFNE